MCSFHYVSDFSGYTEVLYHPKTIHIFLYFKDIVTGMQFGRFGREDGALVMTTRGIQFSLIKIILVVLCFYLLQ